MVDSSKLLNPNARRRGSDEFLIWSPKSYFKTKRRSSVSQWKAKYKKTFLQQEVATKKTLSEVVFFFYYRIININALSMPALHKGSANYIGEYMKEITREGTNTMFELN